MKNPQMWGLLIRHAENRLCPWSTGAHTKSLLKGVKINRSFWPPHTCTCRSRDLAIPWAWSPNVCSSCPADYLDVHHTHTHTGTFRVCIGEGLWRWAWQAQWHLFAESKLKTPWTMLTTKIGCQNQDNVVPCGMGPTKPIGFCVVFV